MTKVDSTLDYIHSVNSAFLSGSDGREIDSRVRTIQNKRKNPKLYLAVIGEFSSGKSTFINALLGYRLLKEAVMPTTACATYIECTGDVLSLSVNFFDGAMFSAKETDFRQLNRYLAIKYGKNSTNLGEVITVLTSDQNVAQTVKELSIRVPGNAIPKNIVIIDTPGFNPGSSSVNNHQEITKNVVENIADAAIILTPQEQAMSATLSRFLNTNLQRCLHRCTYVVTKLDTLDDDDIRRDVMEYARQRIVRDLNVNSPRLFGLSAVTMLPVRRIPMGKEDEWLRFQNEFRAFMHMTWSELQKSKEYVLSEHVTMLVKDVARLCVDKLNKKEADLRADKAFLEAHRVEAIQSVCDKMVVSASNAIYDTISRIEISFSLAESQSKSVAEATINSGIMSLTSFKNEMMPKIKSGVESEAHRTLNWLNTSVNKKVGACVSTQIAKMSEVFESHYNQFPALRHNGSAPTVNLVKFKTPNLNFSIAISKIEALDSKENKAAGGGMAGGAAIGFAFGGPIGAILGGIGGAIFGAAAGDQSDSMRASAIPLVKNEISLFFSSLRSKVQTEISSLRNSYDKVIRNYAQGHINEYGAAVQHLISEHKNKIKDLNTQIKSLRTAVNNLGNVQDDLEHELAMLKIK